MSNYTIELRTLAEDPFFNLFSFDYPFYTDDVEIKRQFEQKFIMHYYNYEIGYETVHRFKYELMAKLNVIMPYYQQLYITQMAGKDIDFLLNKDLREEYTKTINTDSTNKNTMTSDSRVQNDSSVTTSATSKNNAKLSNVADGVSSPALTQGKLTSVGEDSNTASSHANNGSVTNDNSNSSTNTIGNEKVTESNIFTSKGNIGVTSSAELMIKWRSILINIDYMILEECRPLFLTIY